MLPQMFFLILMTASFNFDFSDTYYTFLFGYLGVRFLTLIQYFLIQKLQSGIKKEVSTLLLRIFSLGFLISLSSLFVNENFRYLIMYLGIFIDMFLPIYFSDRLQKVPVHFPHLAERLGLFVLITFGENLVSIASLLAKNPMNWSLILFSLASFSIIALMWFSYFYDHEYKLNHEKITNGQILLYGHFVIFISIMLLAGIIELLYEDHVSRNILLSLLFGAILTFFISKYFIFYYHKKEDSSLYKKESLLLLFSVLIFYIVASMILLSFTTILFLLAAICFVEILVQQGLHKKLQ